MYRFSLRKSDLIFFQNNDDLDFFESKKIVLREKTSLVPGSGVDLEKFKLKDTPSFSSGVKFLMVARLLKDKGVVEYVEAAKRIKSLGLDANFILLGGEDGRNPSAVPDSVIQQWRERDECVVELVGQVEDVRPYLENCHIVVLPSYREGTPRSLLEAAAIGRAIITTDAVGCREVVDHGVNGLLVPIKNVDLLFDAMEKLINNPQLVFEFGVAGRKKVVKQFDEQLVIKQAMEAYEQR